MNTKICIQQYSLFEYYTTVHSGLSEILERLLKQKECTGNERDYYQSTPMHDAAERGNLKLVFNVVSPLSTMV